MPKHTVIWKWAPMCSWKGVQVEHTRRYEEAICLIRRPRTSYMAFSGGYSDAGLLRACTGHDEAFSQDSKARFGQG